MRFNSANAAESVDSILMKEAGKGSLKIFFTRKLQKLSLTTILSIKIGADLCCLRLQPISGFPVIKNH